MAAAQLSRHTCQNDLHMRAAPVRDAALLEGFSNGLLLQLLALLSLQGTAQLVTSGTVLVNKAFSKC